MKSKVVEAYKEERKEVFNKKFGVVFNGDDNLNPTIIENLIDASPTASQCAWIYQTFLGGGGFEVDLSKVNISDNWEVYTPNDLLLDICEPVSRHQGCFIHVNYNANYEKVSFQLLDNSLCRVGKKDSDGYYGKIIVSPKGWGKKVKKDDISVIDVYNPNPIIIQEQVDKAEGWHNYKGQVLFFKLSNKYTYPKSLIETAYKSADTEDQIESFYNSTTKRGFKNVVIARHRKFESDIIENEFVKNGEKVMGAKNASSIWMIQDDWDDDSEKQGNVRFDKINEDEKPDRYKQVESSSANYIRKAFKNIPPQLVDYISGKLGNSSGEDLRMCEAIYNRSISHDRLKVERLFAELFKNYKSPVNISNNWKIKQYSLLNDGTIN